jgi:hypothetical protein
MANERITVAGNSYEPVKTFKCLGSLLTSKFYSQGNKMSTQTGNAYYYYYYSVDVNAL